MSRRVRHSNVTAEEAQPAGLRAGPVESVASGWNATFHSFSPEDRARILALAQPTGVVYAQQLPETKPARKTNEAQRAAFAPFLNGLAERLRPTETKQIAPFDAALDRWQKEAVAKALATSDLFLLRGHPGSGKSRVLVEIIRQAATRGERVLFLSRRAAAIDRVLIALGGAGEGLAARCLQPGENEGLLQPEVRASLLEAQIAGTAHRARQAGAVELAQSQQAVQQSAQNLALYPSLAEILRKKSGLEEQRLAIEARQQAFRQESASFADSSATTSVNGELAALLQAWSEEADLKRNSAIGAVAQLKQAVADSSANLTQLEDQYASLKPIWQARASGQFWKLGWWSSLFKSDQIRRAVELDRQLIAAKSRLEGNQQELAQGIAGQQQVEKQTAEARNKLINEEVARREAAFVDERNALEAALAELALQWQRLCSQSPALAKASITSKDELEHARTKWSQDQERARSAAASAEQWLSFLDHHPNALRDAFLENVPVIAATSAGWQAAREVADRLADRGFDRLILEDAEDFSESECAAYARLAKRWLLVGSDYLLDNELAEGAREAQQKRELVFFGQLWQRLHSTPERLPYAWVEEGDRLICRLRPVRPEQRGWMEVERLADHPQIVLHILALPRSRPVVAEVEFPAAFTIQTAKQLILDQLQELAVCSAGRSMRWHDDQSERLVLQLATHGCHHPAEVALAPGVREKLSPRQALHEGRLSSVAWNTCCIEFDRESGWQRGTAEEWVERHLGLRDIGRTLFLDNLHRFAPSMAAFLRTVLASLAGEMPVTGDWLLELPVEFVAAPLLPQSASADRAGLSRVRPAGLELDLSEPKSRERLPVELRADLTGQGFANLPEAQAIVRWLAELERASALPAPMGSQPAIFIVALYEGQAKLIRRLLGAAPSLAARSSSIEVGAPRSFAHREASLVIVSLTRSHSHRATGFGAGPGDLVLALSRAREKLIVFGDAGALSRRANWEGALERLDARQADQERNLTRLLLAGFQRVESRSAAAGSEGSAP